MPPEAVGNARVIPMSNQAGQSNLRERLARGRDRGARPATRGSAAILAEVKAREDRGYAYDGASASFELLARASSGLLPRFFEVERYRVTVERRRDAQGRAGDGLGGGGGGALRGRAGDERLARATTR